MIILTLSSYAKINLGLRIGERRPDGYHDLATVFQRLSLRDTVALFPRPYGILYGGPRVTEDPRHNLSVIAAESFFKKFDVAGGIEIYLDKKIPTGAGLGGGSSNAAAVLRGLAILHGILPDDPRLGELALELGADVSFFVKDVPAASGTGLGEILEPIESLSPELRVLIIWPGFQVSTAQAYQELDNSLTQPDSNANLVARSLLLSEGGEGRHYVNDFERVIFIAHPELREARDRLLSAGALTAGLAGSGSSLFAIFDGEAEATAAITIAEPSWQCFVCRPC